MKKYYVSYSWSNFSGGGFGSTTIELKKLNFAEICRGQIEIAELMAKDYKKCDVIILNVIELDES